MIEHDRLFKELLTPSFGDFMEVFLPEVAQYLDVASLRLESTRLLLDLAPARDADLLFRGRFRGQDRGLLVHLEHQAQDQARLERRMFHYFARLDEKYDVPVYPIVLYSQGAPRPKADVYEVGFPDLEVLRFRYRVLQLQRLRWQDFARRPSPMAAALLARMGMSVEERPRVKLEALRMLTGLKLPAARQRFLSGFIDVYLRLDAQETLRFEAQADKVLNRAEKRKVMELTTSWKEEGLRQGRQEGLQEGRKEGQAEIVLRLLRRRCGALPLALESRVRALIPSELERLAEGLLDFSGLPDLRRWLKGR